ncbi:MAG TPA: AAA family ATPase [Polyangiaceae bacterium]|nr:AAA family ATPase [Polyangiaceae bacterium]
MAELDNAEVLGRFRLLRRLGAGGMGVVYEALDAATGARVALKTLHEESSAFLPQLKREFRAVHGVQHPNLVEFGELFQAGDRWFFTMELVEGRDYMSWLRGDANAPRQCTGESDVHAPTLELAALTTTPGDERRAPACQLARVEQTLPQLASALAALHRGGLVHRDVKPSNVVITPQGRLVLLDFGLVRSALLDEHQSLQLAGTIAYMAPEQAGGAPVTPAADCYAVGVILYEALTGRPPFVGTAADVLLQKRDSNPVPPGSLVHGVPRALEQLCLELLTRDAALRPSAEQIFRQFSALSLPRSSAPAPSTSHFVGRDEELLQLSLAVDAINEGQPSAVLVHGESGIGKTCLLVEACRRLKAAGPSTLLLRSRCFERETVNYAGVDMLIDALAAHVKQLPAEQAFFVAPRYADLLCQLFPALASVPGFASLAPQRRAMSSHEARARAHTAFHELFARLAVKYQVVLVIDDAQWLTEASRMLLSSLFSAEDRVPLLLLLSARPAAVSSLRSWLDELACVRGELALGPLATLESIALLRQYELPANADALAAMAVDGAGHPLFLHELASAAGERSGGDFAQLDDCLRSRAGQLSPHHGDVLKLVCAGARPIASRIIGRAAELGVAGLDTILRDLKQQRFLVAETLGSQTLLQPAHDRVRQALLEEISADAHVELQRRLALAMEQHDPEDVDALAVQWSSAGDRERAAIFARQAAEKAMKMLAFERAVELCQMALKSAQLSASERGSSFVVLGDALANLGRSAAAAAAYLEATHHCSALQVDELVLRGADQLIRSGRIDDGKRLLERVLERLGIELPTTQQSAIRSLVLGRMALKLQGSKPRKLTDEERARLLRCVDACWSIGDLLGLVDPIKSSDLHTRGLRFALQAAEPLRLARSLASDAWFVASSGKGAKRGALERLRQAESLVRNTSSPQIEGWITLCRGVVSLQFGEFEEAQGALDSAEDTFEHRCQGAFFEASYAREFGAWTLAYRGELEALLQRLPKALELASVSDNRLAVLRLRCGPSHVALLARDEPQQLIAACSEGTAGLSQETYPFVHLCTLFARSHAGVYLGRASDAFEALEAELLPIQRAQLQRNPFFRIDLAGLRARTALAAMAERAAGEGTRLVETARRSARELRGEGVAWAAALAGGIEASLQLLSLGDPREATMGLNRAAAQLAASGLGLYANALRHQALRCSPPREQSKATRSGCWDDRAIVVRPDRLAQTFAPLPVAWASCTS